MEREFEVSITRAVPGAVLDVSVNGTVVTQITVNASGYGHLEFKSYPDEAGELPFPTGFMAPLAGDTIDIGGVASGVLA